MLEQTFSVSDIPRVFVLIFLEWLLSVDNALLLALIAKKLPTHLQKKALIVGLGSTIILRAIAILCIAYLIQYAWIQWIGSIYLIYLSIRYFRPHKKLKEESHKTSRSFWATVFWIECTDLFFALDSILAGVAFISTSLATDHVTPKLWIIYLGALIGLIGVRFAARKFTSLLDFFPRLPAASHILIGWIGLHLALSGFIQIGWIPAMDLSYEITFWTGTILLFGFGLSKRVKAHS